MSIELCNTSGVDALSALLEKIASPTRLLRVGGSVVDRVLIVSHSIEDGRPVVEYTNEFGEVEIFQFVPSDVAFKDTAVDSDGQPICIDC